MILLSIRSLHSGETDTSLLFHIYWACVIVGGGVFFVVYIDGIHCEWQVLTHSIYKISGRLDKSDTCLGVSAPGSIIGKLTTRQGFSVGVVDRGWLPITLHTYIYITRYAWLGVVGEVWTIDQVVSRGYDKRRARSGRATGRLGTLTGGGPRVSPSPVSVPVKWSLPPCSRVRGNTCRLPCSLLACGPPN